MTFALPPPRRAAVAAPADGLTGVFDELSRRVNRDSAQKSVRLGVLMSAGGRRAAYGPLLLIIGLIAISPATIPPGMTALAAAVTLLVALQMALGFKRPWLPRRVLAIRLPRRATCAFLDTARTRVARVDGVLLKERFAFLAAGPFAALVALCVAAAALLTFPLSIVPLAPIAPSLAVLLFGLGMTARDGLLLALAMALTALAAALAIPLIWALIPS